MDIRLLAPDELPACQKLEQDRQWATDEAKWRLMFEVGEVHAIDAPDGDGLAGCVVLTRHGDDLAAVGMMLVATRYGRQGLGTRLMKHAIERADGRVLELTANRFGRPVYERLGFQSTGTLTIHFGSLPDLRAEGVREATPDDHHRVLALDAEATGADRSKALTRLLAVAEKTVTAEGGFAIAWNAGSQRVIGPVVAPSEEVARNLILAAAQGADRELRVDVLETFGGVRTRLRDLGMRTGENTLHTMVHGGARHPGDRSRYVAPITVSVG